MPDSRIESILKEIQSRLEAALDAGVLRNEALPTAIPAAGMVILRDGEPGEPETTLSPLTWHYQHEAEIEMFVSGADREADFDALKQGVGAVVSADRSLGGLCDWIEAMAPQTDDLPFEGGPTVKAALVTVRIDYSTSDPLS